MVTDEPRSRDSLILPDDVEPVAELLKGLSNPQRLMIVCALAKGELGVADLERDLSIRQPSLSQHLGSLREAGFIAGRREGKAVFYRLSDHRAAMLVEALNEIFRKPTRPGRHRAPTFIAKSERSTTAASNPPSPPTSSPSQAAVFARVGESENA
jgi:DNA-binding transcriptional ArsR family regulator